MVNNKEGSLQVPLCLGLAIALIFAMGLLGLMRHWRGLVELQLRLDRCVGRTGMEFRDKLESIENANTRIKAIRAALVPASLAPPVRASLQTALYAEALFQDISIAKWELKRAGWLIKRGCDSKSDMLLPLPAMPWKRLPPDSIGPLPLYWTAKPDETFKITLWHKPRSCSAEIKKTNRWSAKWASSGLF